MGKPRYNARFPLARIKKIMQGDDDIGKITSTAPVVMSCCIEQFLTDLMSVALGKRASGLYLAAAHVKRAVEQEHRFDFLKDHVAGVSDVIPDPPKRGRKPKDRSLEPVDEAGGVTKKRRKRRSKKSDDLEPSEDSVPIKRLRRKRKKKDPEVFSSDSEATAEMPVSSPKKRPKREKVQRMEFSADVFDDEVDEDYVFEEELDAGTVPGQPVLEPVARAESNCVDAMCEDLSPERKPTVKERQEAGKGGVNPLVAEDDYDDE